MKILIRIQISESIELIFAQILLELVFSLTTKPESRN